MRLISGTQTLIQSHTLARTHTRHDNNFQRREWKKESKNQKRMLFVIKNTPQFFNWKCWNNFHHAREESESEREKIMKFIAFWKAENGKFHR